MIRTEASDILYNVSSEAGVIASLLHQPELIFYSENLLPLHFSRLDNRCIYAAIQDLVGRGITNIDAYNISEVLSTSEKYRKMAHNVTVEKLNELIEMSDCLARHTAEEYKMLSNNVLEAAFRRTLLQRLQECENICRTTDRPDVEQEIYDLIDNVMTEYASSDEIPPFSDVVDQCWSEIVERQQDGYPGIPFKFRALNDYVTMEKGELILFGAGPKEGKSMMLLNCAVDLLRQDKAIVYLDSELSTRLFTARLLSHLTGIRYRDLTSGNYGEEDAKRIEEQLRWIKTRKFTHIYFPIFDKQAVYTAIRKIEHTQGLDVVIVDYFKAGDEGDAFDTYRDLGGMVNLIKNQVCGALNIPGLGAVQTTDTGKVADSRRIVRNASTIIFIQPKTPEEIEADGPECGNKKMIVAFNRNGMQHAKGEYIDVRFDGDHILYEEAKQHIPDMPF